VHRDLKPANLMLVQSITESHSNSTFAATIKVLDIGLGRRVWDERARADDQDTQLTSEGVMLGTPDYWAPEQARDSHAVDIRADIYSVGCILYHCLTGQPPFPDTEMLSQMIRHVSEAPRPACELNPEVPDGLQQVLNFMMAKDASQRYPTPERAARALQLFLPIEGLDIPNSEVAMAEKKPNPKPPTGGEIPVGKLVGKTEKPAPPAVKPKSKPTEPVATVPVAVAPVAMAVVEYDVELVAIPCPPPVAPRKPREQRSLFDLDRRDFLMMSAGVGGTVAAVLFGLGVAKLLQRKPEEPVKVGE